jgi:anti-sigma factor RsiW
LLRADAPYHRAPESLRRAIVAGLGEKAPQRARSPAWWRDGASFAIGAAMAAAIALLVIAPAQQDLIDQVVAGHVRALQPGHLEDVVSTDQHTVKPWFDGKLDFAPPVKDLAAKNFPLLGGRLDYLGGREVAALVYGHDKHIIDLFVWPERDGLAPSGSARNGYNVVHWSAGGMNFWAVSDLEAGELRTFVQQWQAES